MGTIVEKLQRALLSKEDARLAINEKGVECSKKVEFRHYGDKIRLIGTNCWHKFKNVRFGEIEDFLPSLSVTIKKPFLTKPTLFDVKIVEKVDTILINKNKILYRKDVEFYVE